MTKFKAFPKIPRLFRDCVITEKIDGTNACVVITEHPTHWSGDDPMVGEEYEGGIVVADPTTGNPVLVQAQSRKRFVTPEADNYGFAAWVREHAEQLVGLGEGYHYGEWYGKGIQRGYGMNERRFALFNVSRWFASPERPSCCDVVPLLAEWRTFSEKGVRMQLDLLRSYGSFVAGGYGFSDPEGIVVFHRAGKHFYKVLLDNDELPKGLAA